MADLVLRLRPEVAWFAQQMERVLRRNDHKGGWEDEELIYLVERLGQERRELNSATRKVLESTHWRDEAKLAAKALDEAVDVANFALMIADRLRGLAANLHMEGPRE